MQLNSNINHLESAISLEKCKINSIMNNLEVKANDLYKVSLLALKF